MSEKEILKDEYYFNYKGVLYKTLSKDSHGYKQTYTRIKCGNIWKSVATPRLLKQILGNDIEKYREYSCPSISYIRELLVKYPELQKHISEKNPYKIIV